MPSYHDVASLEKIALGRMAGWSYGFYADKTRFREDVLVIRDQVGLLLTSIRKSVEMAEQAYRREFLPPPSREKPRQDPVAVSNAQTLERLAKAVAATLGLLHHLPVPDPDPKGRQVRTSVTLKALMDSDQRLVGQAELLRGELDGKAGAWLVENLAEVQEGLDAIGDTIRRRQPLLVSP